MAEQDEILIDQIESDYKYGFVTDIEQEFAEKGLNENIVRFISAKKKEPEWMLEWRLKAYEQWKQMKAPQWQNVTVPEIQFNDLIYYAAPKKKVLLNSLDEVDPELLRTYEKLGLPKEEQKMLAGVAVDFVMDSESVFTTFKASLKEKGIIFCSISEAVHDYPRPCKTIHGKSSACARQFLRCAQFSRVFRWLICIYS
jgi:Fe-S cluster assembly protein SufB